MRRMVRFGGAGADAGFRLSVSPGGCSGYASEFSVEAAPKPGDVAVDINGVKLFLPVESRLMLEGITIDFTDTPRESGLTFVNPNATGCGTCGTSSTSSSSASGPAPVTVDISSIQRRS